MNGWSPRDERQYVAIVEQQLGSGKKKTKAAEIAARTVNKRRRMEGRTPNTTTMGTGNPHSPLEERNVDELRNIAAGLRIPGRSRLTRKKDLILAIRKARG